MADQLVKRPVVRSQGQQQQQVQQALQQMGLQRNMAKGGIIGNGMKVGYSLTSPLSYNKLEQLLDANPPTLTPDKIDTTRHGTSRLKSNVPGMLDIAPTTIKCLYDADPATSPNVNGIPALVNSQASIYLRIEVPTAGGLFVAWELSGRFASYTVAAPIMARQEVTIQFFFDGIDYIVFGTPAASVLG